MTGCKKTCASDELDCYVLDNNGFIIISEQSHHTGQFFGQTDGTIMDSLVQDGIYKKITVTDNQGACHSGIEPGTDSASALQVIRSDRYYRRLSAGQPSILNPFVYAIDLDRLFDSIKNHNV